MERPRPVLQQEGIKEQHRDYFCPHQGLTFDFVNGRVIGHNGKEELTKMQKKLLYCLVKKQIEGRAGGWCYWDELEKRLHPNKWKYDIVDGKRVPIRRLTRAERLDRVQKAVYLLRAKLRKVYPCKSLIEYGIYKELEAYRLTALSSCA